MKSYKQIIVIFLFAFLGGTVSAQQLNKSFSGIDQIEISTGSSDCIVKKGTGDEVNVRLDHTRGDSYKPVVEKSGSKLLISEKNQNGSTRGEATWTLTIPDNLELSFNTGSGDFEAANLNMELSLNAGSGDFEMNGMKGSISSNAGSGDLEMDNFEGKLAANVGSGDLEIANAKGKVSLNSGSGDIELSAVNGTIEANVGSGDVEADQVTLAGASSFNSGSGDVSVVLSNSPEYDISVNSGSGDSELDFNGHEINATVIMTANKRNGSINAPFAFDKEEEIKMDGQTIMKKTAKLGNGSATIKIGTGSGDASVSN